MVWLSFSSELIAFVGPLVYDYGAVAAGEMVAAGTR
jgi:hypothetical protein